MTKFPRCAVTPGQAHSWLWGMWGMCPNTQRQASMYQEANEANKTREVGGRRSWWIKQNGRRCGECALSRSIKLSKGFTKKLQTKS